MNIDHKNQLKVKIYSLVYNDNFMIDSKKLESLLKSYKSKKDMIRSRLEEFKNMTNESDKKIFAELCFCICTPQSKAEACNRAICKLEDNNLLFTGTREQIRPFLNSVRFCDRKSDYLIKARDLFTTDGEIEIKKKLTAQNLREWLINNVKGLGYKEASHFMRNIGLGKPLAILDRHILKNLILYGAIKEIPKSLTKKRYLEIEDKMRQFSRKVKIPMDELDLLFWSEETGKIFK
jgi:N-glycosylase/DNA lyase